MGLFSKRAAAFCWNSKGECFGVLMSRDGQNYKVAGYWAGKSKNQDAISSVLLEGYKKLNVNENDLVVVGEMGMKCSFADLKQPLMNHKDLKKSLSFTLSSHFPIDPVNLNWAYRVVNEKDEDGLGHLRLLAMKSKTWNEWLDHIGSMKVDLIVPPAAVADAVIQDPVYIEIDDVKGFITYINGDGLLHTEPAIEAELDDSVFGAGSSPLDFEGLDVGALGKDSTEKQKRFTQVILLGMYGLTEGLKSDRETCFETPKALIPKRNALTKTLCSFFAVVLVMVGIFQLSRVVAFKKKEAAMIVGKTEALTREAKRNMVDRKRLESMQELQAEIDTRIKPELAISARDVLAVVTKNLPKSFYLTSFQYSNLNKVSCKVMEVSSESDPSAENVLYEKFKKVDFFEDDVAVQKGSKDISLNLTVRRNIVLPEVK